MTVTACASDVDDIEDFDFAGDDLGGGPPRSTAKTFVGRRAKLVAADTERETLAGLPYGNPDARPGRRALHSPPSSAPSPAPGSNKCMPLGVPGTEAVWVKTFGCSHNISDSEYMAGQLQEYGYSPVSARISASLSTTPPAARPCAPR
ncbi:Threonylcarbamoyladenosine tRNA methylthiotransferase [Tetrabaena socialis]|uniref:Threonylcarbamoyladenosine tRNA methylthiotransferase n=1 Tax=Tetrabaena socialis TaxID=47790 RepID=A0A2J8A0A7_9CHLO|nr:Threonylcarbamoyladenosine tRNA methylthiotransferase [Tetrabaena socialis]|eukprot:PNH05950.1 Threonylcarbamoyladenosine tRNA methylthiotransferase [Tetrabaena socialis]